MGDGRKVKGGNNRLSALSNLGGIHMLEWRPRLIFLLLVIVLIALAAGFSSSDFGISTGGIGFDNWEW
jgi:hypothetical protein